MENPIARSLLFVPGNRPERFAKACASGADAVIVDLEDAVPPDEKATARAAVRAWLSPAHPALLRINAADTGWFAEDAQLCRLPGVAGVVLPKAERTADIEALTSIGGAGLAVLPLIESAHGLWHAQSIAGTRSVQRLIFGTIDFQLDLGMRAGEDEMLPFRTQLVLASRMAGIAPPVDGVTVAINDATAIAADTARARRLGFGGKLCIHPRQVGIVNAGFAPTAAEVAWARNVVQAAARAAGAAVAVDGKMVDRPVILRAEAILRDATQRAHAHTSVQAIEP